MNIIVCIKQILDPEIPARDFRVDSAQREAERGGASLVTNIFCENALETALQFRDAHGGKITVITCGGEATEEVLRNPQHPYTQALLACIPRMGVKQDRLRTIDYSALSK